MGAQTVEGEVARLGAVAASLSAVARSARFSLQSAILPTSSASARAASSSSFTRKPRPQSAARPCLPPTSSRCRSACAPPGVYRPMDELIVSMVLIIGGGGSTRKAEPRDIGGRGQHRATSATGGSVHRSVKPARETPSGLSTRCEDSSRKSPQRWRRLFHGRAPGAPRAAALAPTPQRTLTCRPVHSRRRRLSLLTQIHPSSWAINRHCQSSKLSGLSTLASAARASVGRSGASTRMPKASAPARSRPPPLPGCLGPSWHLAQARVAPDVPSGLA